MSGGLFAAELRPGISVHSGLGGAAGGFARRDGRSISRAAFLRDVAALARLLPARGQVINLCRDRYRFAVGFAAALSRGQVSLLPPSEAEDVLARLARDYPDAYCLSDAPPPHPPAGQLPDWFAYPDRLEPADAPGAIVPILMVPGEQVAAVLFTSGSTGRPQPHPRRWDRLVDAADAAGRRLGLDRLAGASLIGTVPHQHSYGLESLVMLALRHPLELECGRGFYPADICARLAAAPSPRVLVTTPLHLRLLLAQPGALPAVELVVCATAPLAPELAAAAEARFGGAVMEIYGCTEAGQLATRRPTQDAAWRCLDGFSVWLDEAGRSMVRGPGGPGELELADLIEPRGDGGFLLLGRTADQVNIAGKRGSLAHLTHHLAAIEGVLDAAFVQDDEAPADGRVGRLAAVAVAPGLSRAHILGELRRRIDPAFLPRPLCLLPELPRDRLGKLARAQLLALVRAARRRPAGPVPPAKGEAECGFAADHPTAAGHFPGNPVIPGAVLLAGIRASLRARGLDALPRAARFHRPVRPGERLRVAWESGAEGIRFSATVPGAPGPAVTGLLCPAPGAASGGAG